MNRLGKISGCIHLVVCGRLFLTEKIIFWTARILPAQAAAAAELNR
jgi:hypothetical protein